MYLCIINSEGEIVLYRNMKADPESLLRAIKPYRPDILIGVECIFTWYRMSDLCSVSYCLVYCSSLPENDNAQFYQSQGFAVRSFGISLDI